MDTLPQSSAPLGPVREACDILIVGGGPAGSAAAILRAQQGHRVVLVETYRQPRFHIGESLLPANLPLFERLGAVRDCGRREGNLSIYWFAHGWFWFIPLAELTSAVGAAAAETLDICLREPRRALRGLFLGPRHLLRLQEALLSLLAGEIFGNTPIRTSLRLFKGLYYLFSLGHPGASDSESLHGG